MPKPSTVFVCSSCGAESAKWRGQCPDCQSWNTLAEEARGAAPKSKTPGRAVKPVPLSQVEAVRYARLATNIGELDRVLGGGLVPGSLVLIGGGPGLGEATLVPVGLGNPQRQGPRELVVSRG